MLDNIMLSTYYSVSLNKINLSIKRKSQKTDKKNQTDREFGVRKHHIGDPGIVDNIRLL